MGLTEEEKESLDNKIEALQKQKEEDQNNIPMKVDEESFKKATQQALEEFKPTYNNSKSLYENGKDFVKTIGLRDALEDDKFREENKEKAKQNIRIDTNTEQIKSEIEEQKQLYNKLEPVLKFARMMEPCDKHLMWITYGFSLLPFCLCLVISDIFNLIGGVFTCLNSLFNSIFGVTDYLKDGEGKIVLDEKKRPIPNGARINLLTKILFSVIITFISLLILFGMVKAITGFDILAAIRSFITG